MSRSVPVLAFAVVAGPAAFVGWQNHQRSVARSLAAAQAPAMTPARAAQVAPVDANAGRRNGASTRTPLGAAPTAAEIEALLRASYAEVESHGGVGVALSQTGQRLPDGGIDTLQNVVRVERGQPRQ